MKIIQIATDAEDSLIALTDDGRIFTGFWGVKGFQWHGEITPSEHQLKQLPLKLGPRKDDD